MSVENACVEKTDNMAANGVIHVIDRVLFPPEQDVLQIIQNDAYLKWVSFFIFIFICLTDKLHVSIPPFVTSFFEKINRSGYGTIDIVSISLGFIVYRLSNEVDFYFAFYRDFANALVKSGVSSRLSEPGQFTVFAPSRSAMRRNWRLSRLIRNPTPKLKQVGHNFFYPICHMILFHFYNADRNKLCMYVTNRTYEKHMQTKIFST